MLKSKGVQVATKAGVLTAKYNNDPEFPGIRVELDGALVALIEVTNS